MELKPGTVLNNRYRLIRLLGEGGMGSIHLAYDISLESEVALKCNQNPAPESTNQFLREARLLASLRHPHLPRVIDYFISDQSQFLVMDYIAGDDLEKLLKTEGAQPLEKVLKWAEQIGSALNYLHSQQPPVIHRDVKPANLKLTPDGDLMLVDFGIAKASDGSQATATGALGYTPGFAPPEQYGGARTTPHSDQYAFAATLYNLLTNQRPSDSVQRVLGKAVLTPMNLLNPATPAHVQQAIETAMAVRPEDRYPSVHDFVRALTDPSYQPTLIRPAAATPGVSPKAKKRSTACILSLAGLAALVMVIAVLGIGSFVLWRQGVLFASPTLTPPQIARQAPSLTPDVLTAAAESKATIGIEAATITPSPTADASPTPTPRALGGGKPVAFVSDRADGETLQIWNMKIYLDHGGKIFADDFDQLTFNEGNKQQPVWSPDGSRLLYSAPGDTADAGLDIWLLDVSTPGSQPVNLTQLKGDDTDPTWSPDGMLIAFTNSGRFVAGVSAVYFMNPVGSNLRRISTDFIEYSPFWTPDNQTLLHVIFARDNRYLYQRQKAHDYATPQPYDPTSLFGRLGQVADPAISPDGSTIAYTRVEGEESQICSVDYRSRGARINVLTPNHNRESQPAWSPDSQYIVFASQRDGAMDIYVMTAAGQLQTNLTQSAARDMHPHWQP